MKALGKLFVIGITFLSITACNQNSSEGKDKANANKGEVSHLKSDEGNTATTLFKEGIINLRITTPGTAFGELLQEVDPTKGDISGQMKALSAKLSPKERVAMEAQSKKAGIMNMAILMLPLKSVIYIKGNEATAKFDALTFHGENNINDAKKSGLMYIKSQNSSKAMTISYTGDSFEEMASTELKSADYDIVNTNETSTVAGYSCTKSIYTLKNVVAPKSASEGLPAGGAIYQIDVWTSKQMPKSVNFLHPLYIKEDAGIMKLLIQYEKGSDLKFLYEFTEVDSRPVTAAEIAIKKTEKINDFGKDKLTVGMQMMGIVFGM